MNSTMISLYIFYIKLIYLYIIIQLYHKDLLEIYLLLKYSLLLYKGLENIGLCFGKIDWGLYLVIGKLLLLEIMIEFGAVVEHILG
jgi:hypothetical protein